MVSKSNFKIVLIKVRFIVFNATFNNISVLLVDETGVPWENYRSAANNWHTLSHNVVLSTPRPSVVQTHNASGDRQ
jgi:hypothetical protein